MTVLSKEAQVVSDLITSPVSTAASSESPPSTPTRSSDREESSSAVIAPEQFQTTSDEEEIHSSPRFGFPTRRKGICCFVLLGSFLMISGMVAGAVVLAMTLGNDNKYESDGDESNNQDFDQTEYFLKIRDFLLDGDIASTLNSRSPELLAVQWLAFEDDLYLSVTDEQLIQRYALSVLFYSWDGDYWPFVQRGLVNNTFPEGWNTVGGIGSHECSWRFVSCNDDGQVEALLMGGDSLALTGSLPTQIQMLSNLRFFDVSLNRLEGTIPEELYEITTMEYFDLSFNEFSGTVSSAIQNWTNLELIALSNNFFHGTLPDEVDSLSSIEWFYGEFNNFEGSFFDHVLHWPSIIAVDISETSFSSTIPRAIGNMTNLKHIGIWKSLISGTIPDEIALPHLEQLVLGSTRLHGTIPTSFGLMENLCLLSLPSSTLSGTLPAELGRLSNLQLLALQFSEHIGGTIPTEFGMMENLRILHLAGTDLDGPIPTELGRLSNLESFWVHATRVAGPMPEEVCELESLKEVRADCFQNEVACSCCTECF